MAKNKNRKQPGAQERSSVSGRAPRQAKSSTSEAQPDAPSTPVASPADVARKHQRRFGHN